MLCETILTKITHEIKWKMLSRSAYCSVEEMVCIRNVNMTIVLGKHVLIATTEESGQLDYLLQNECTIFPCTKMY